MMISYLGICSCAPFENECCSVAHGCNNWQVARRVLRFSYLCIGKLYPFNIFRDHSNYSLNTVDSQYLLCYSVFSFHPGGEGSASLCPLPLHLPPPLPPLRTRCPASTPTWSGR